MCSLLFEVKIKIYIYIYFVPDITKNSIKKVDPLAKKKLAMPLRSKNEFVNFSGSGWDKIDQLWRRGRWKKKRIREWDGKNFVRMRSILSLKKSRNVLAREDASGDSGSEFEGFRWRIVFRVFQSVRGLADDSVTRLDKNEDLALEMRDLTKLHWARNFMRSKRLPATPTSMERGGFVIQAPPAQFKAPPTPNSWLRLWSTLYRYHLLY